MLSFNLWLLSLYHFQWKFNFAVSLFLNLYIFDCKNCLRKGDNSDLECNDDLNAFLRQKYVKLGKIGEV